MCFVCLTLSSIVVVRMELPCVVLLWPEAFVCRVLIPPEAWN